MLKRIFSPQTTGLAAFVLTGASFLSYIMGLVRDRTLSHFFGASHFTDAYNAAFLIPDAIFNLFVAGALTASFIPVISGFLQDSEEEKKGFEVINSFLTLALIVVALVSIVILIFMPHLIGYLFSGVSLDQQDLIINLTRILLLSPILFCVSNTLGNLLVVKKHFTSYALGALFYNLGIIIGIAIGYKTLGIYAAAIGAVFGISLHLGLRVLELIFMQKFENFKFKLRLNFDFSQPGLKKIIALMIPKTVGLMAWQITLWVYTIIGSTILVEGSVAAFNYARNLQSFPVSLFGIALATAVFPYLSDHANALRKEQFVHHFQKSFRQILFLALPSMVGIMILSFPIVDLLLGSGAFDKEDTLMTATTLFFFAFAIPSESLVHLVARGFYAYKNTFTPVTITVFTLILNITGTFIFAPLLGVKAFAIFFSIGSVLQISILLFFLRSKLSGFGLARFGKSFFKIIVLCFFMGASLLALTPLSVYLGIKVLVVIQIATGGAVYLIGALILKCEEIEEVKRIWSRLTRRKVQS